jgi:hypothetical protein
MSASTRDAGKFDHEFALDEHGKDVLLKFQSQRAESFPITPDKRFAKRLSGVMGR